MEKNFPGNSNIDILNEYPTIIDIFSNSPIAIELYNKDGKLTEVNRACLDLFGIQNIEQVRGFNLFEDPNLPEQAKIDIRFGKSVKYEFEFDFELVKSRNLYPSSRSGKSYLECSLNPTFSTRNEIKGYILYISEITKRKQSEELLKINELKYRTIFNFISEAIFVYNISDGRIIDVNDAMLKMYGFESKEEVISKIILDLSANTKPYSQQVAENLIQNTSSEGKQIFEWLAKKKNGSAFWIEMTLQQTIIGGIHCILAVGRDITEHKQIIRILAESEDKYRSLIQYSSDPIFSFNPDETYRFVNETFAKAFGKKPEDIIGKTPYEIFSAEESDKRLATVRQVFKTGNKSEIEVKVVTDTGLTKFFLTMADPITNSYGQVLYVTCVSKEITQRKLAEEALLESRERYRNLIELAVDGVIVGSNDGYIIEANSCICKMVGKSKEELIGLHISDSIFSENSLKQNPLRFDLLSEGETVVSERSLIHSDGTELAVEMRTKMMPDGTYQSIYRDISSHIQAQEEIERKNKELSILNKTKDKFLSIIAHDLKNPFNAIIGFTDLMLNNFTQMDDETLIRGLKTIESASNHAYKLLENLLLWSKNQTGMTEFKPEKLNLFTQISESLSIVESAAMNKNISIQLRVKKNHEILADKNMIDTILRNLISNAIKFSYRGGKIKITASEEFSKIHISIIDEGIGINLEKRDSIFTIDKKTQVLGTEDEQGTGLGLILCKDFVTRHEGQIWVEKNAKKGSNFTFSMPLVCEIS